ncbi:MAG: hypothetical protein ACTSX9_06985 [Candidatus Njordarchaeales archaeon]
MFLRIIVKLRELIATGLLKKMKKKEIFHMFIPLAINIIVYRSYLIESLVVGGDFKYLSPYFFVYHYKLGIFWYYYQPLYVLIGLLTSIFNLSFSIIEKVFFLYIIVFIMPVSMYVLSRHITKSPEAAIIASILFSLNSYILYRGSGHIHLAVSYAIAPVPLYLTYKTLESDKRVESFFWNSLLVISLIVIFLYSIHNSLLTLILIVALMLYNSLIDVAVGKASIRQIVRSIIHLAFTSVMFFVTTAYFWIPSIISLRSSSLIYHVDPRTRLRWLSWTNLFNTIILRHGHWPIVDYYPWALAIVTALVYSSLTLVRNFREKKNVIFYSIVSIISTFLVKGYNAPFPQFNEFLLMKIPLFGYYNEPQKFFLLLCVSYSILIGITTREAILGIEKIIEFKKILNMRFVKIRKIVIGAMIFLLLIPFASFIMQPRIGTYSPVSLPKEYFFIDKFIEQDPENFKFIWWPNEGKYRIFYPDKQPIRTNDLPLIKFLMYNNKLDVTLELLARLNVKYLIPRDKEAMFFLTNHSDSLLQKVRIGDNFYIFQNSFYVKTHHVYGANSLIILFGGYKSILALHSMLRNLSLSVADYLWVILEDRGMSDRTVMDYLIKADIVLLCDADLRDLALFILAKNYSIDLYSHAEYIGSDTHLKGRGWIAEPGLVSKFYLHDGEIPWNGKGFIVGMRNASLTVPFSVRYEGEYYVFLRAMRIPESFKIIIDSKELYPQYLISSESTENKLHIIPFGKIYLRKNIHHTVSIIQETSRKWGAVLDTLIIVPKQVMDNMLNIISKTISDKLLVVRSEGNEWIGVSERNIQSKLRHLSPLEPIHYKKQSLTSYVVNISIALKYKYLILSEPYYNNRLDSWNLAYSGKILKPIKALGVAFAFMMDEEEKEEINKAAYIMLKLTYPHRTESFIISSFGALLLISILTYSIICVNILNKKFQKIHSIEIHRGVRCLHR